MNARIVILCLVSGVLAIGTYNNLMRPFDNAADVLVWMTYLLMMAVVVIWPKSDKDARTEDEKRAWSDKIKFRDRSHLLHNR